MLLYVLKLVSRATFGFIKRSNCYLILLNSLFFCTVNPIVTRLVKLVHVAVKKTHPHSCRMSVIYRGKHFAAFSVYSENKRKTIELFSIFIICSWISWRRDNFNIRVSFVDTVLILFSEVLIEKELVSCGCCQERVIFFQHRDSTLKMSLNFF